MKAENKKKKTVNWYDKSIPVGKRRQAYVKWQMRKAGLSLEEAKYNSKVYIH